MDSPRKIMTLENFIMAKARVDFLNGLSSKLCFIWIPPAKKKTRNRLFCSTIEFTFTNYNQVDFNTVSRES